MGFFMGACSLISMSVPDGNSSSQLSNLGPAPEFSHERDLDNLIEAVNELSIRYPVAQDNSGETWRAYDNRYWPTLYLIDKRGDIRYQHIGEGGEQEIEFAIQVLLAEPYL